MEVQTADSKARRRGWLGVLGVCVAILAVTAWAYRPALDADFVLDDASSIVDNPAIHWTAVSWDNVKVAWSTSRLRRRFVANLSFALNHAAGGLDPFGYHLVNVLIHLAAGVALAWLIAIYLRAHPRAGAPPYPLGLVPIALPVALFLVHPLNTQAVTYVVQRMTSLAALFALLSLAIYLGARTRLLRRRVAWYALASVLWLLGLKTKQNVLALVLVVVIYEWCFHRAFWTAKWQQLWSQRNLRPLVIGTLAVGLAGSLLLLDSYAGLSQVRLLEDFPSRDFNGEERLATQARVHWLYMSQLVLPVPSRLNLDHDFQISRTLLTPPSTIFAIVGVLALIGASGWLAARRPRIGFPLLAYWALHSIESGPLSLEMVFEHRMYLPMAMLALTLAVILNDLRGRWRVPVVVATTFAVVLLAGWTRARNETWSDLVLLAEDTARKSPLKRRAQADLGVAYMREGRYEEAEEALLFAIGLEPNLAKTRQALGVLYLEMGRPEEAAAVLSDARRFDPVEPRIKYAIGEALEDQGRAEEAFAYYMGLGTQYGMEGKPFPAIEPLRRAVRLKPEDPVARNSLGNVYAMAEMLEDAVVEYQRAVELAPRNGEANYNLATTLDRLGRLDEAILIYRRFVELAPSGLADHVRYASERIREIESAGS